MKGTKLLLSFWLSTVAFCVLQIVFGPAGLVQTARLQEYQTRLDSRLEALQGENLRLKTRYDALRTSTEAVRLEARALGYFRPGETPVRTLDGAGFRLPSEEPDLSVVPAPAANVLETSLFFRLAWPLLFLVFFAFLHLWELLWPAGQPRAEPLRLPLPNLPARLQTGLDFFRK